MTKGNFDNTGRTDNMHSSLIGTQCFFRFMSSYKRCPLVHEYLQDAPLKRENNVVSSFLEFSIYGKETLLDPLF